MNQHIEIEFKNLLDEKEFRKLIDHFEIEAARFTSQQNHYFDTSDFELKNRSSALRIRKKNDRYELTLKQPAKEGLLETNQAITAEAAIAFLKDGTFPEGSILSLLTADGLDTDAFTCFGTLETDRFEFPYKEGLLVLDHSSYLDQEDYELEYEVTDAKAGKNIFINLLETLQIPERKTENKVKRFYRAKFKD
ncbi:CYTH domain-containing protein [Peribacillus muralis]|uniref:CYTH domain-containing protein n=1 Tax=Peribacillus muralis TaxID=264697 RepID=A0A1B3XL34_9BACI|nr:CYTH domain-containing protein [Peribacillus muralis]AOH53934.1 CYTH domain-containing protein [Peribacillus muralis]